VKQTRKPFVAPQVKEQASLARVTLISGGGPTRGNNKPHGSSHPNGNSTRHG
jgi:hypothetical protein